MNLRPRIWSLPIVSAVLFTIGIALAVGLAAGTSKTIRSLGEVRYPYMDLVTRASQMVSLLSITYQSAAAEGDADRLKAANEQAGALTAVAGEIGVLPGLKPVGKQLSEKLEAYAGSANKAVRLMTGSGGSGDPMKAIEAMQSAKLALDEYLSEHRKLATASFNEGLENSEAGVKRGLYLLIGSALIIVAVLGVVSWFIIGTVWKQLGGEPDYARNMLHAMATGDLTNRVVVDDQDKSSLLCALRDMQDGLRRIVGEVRTGTDSILTASREIAVGNQDLSSRTESQVVALAETTGSMAQMTETVRQNAKNADEANKLAVSAAEIASAGGVAVRDIVDTMSAIHESSSRIAEIISVIDGIAFQTNILALNAAVESARAGEHGRGFAVVAGEVRALAQRSATAASEIGGLIRTSVGQVQTGGERVRRAGETIDEVVAAAKRVTPIMDQISSASNEQATGINGIGESVRRMDQSTQQNAALVEQAAAAASSLENQAAQLLRVVENFKLDPVN